MAILESTQLRAHLATLLNHEHLESWAKQAGLFQREHRKLTPSIFVASFVLAAFCLPERSIAATRGLFCELSGNPCAYSSFYTRIGKPLTAVLKQLFNALLAATPTSSLKGVLGPEVEQVTALDTCIVRFWDGLHARWPSTAPDKAGLKLHLAVNVLEATATKLKLGPEPGSEGTPWKRLGTWVKGHLLRAAAYVMRPGSSQSSKTPERHEAELKTSLNCFYPVASIVLRCFTPRFLKSSRA